MVHQKIVDRIAAVYFDKYTRLGYNAATEYAERAIGLNAELEERVRAAVETKVKELKENRNGPDRPQ